MSVDYICSNCAIKLGWKWPTGHAATMHSAECDVCGKKRTLSCQNDWLKYGEKKLAYWD